MAMSMVPAQMRPAASALPSFMRFCGRSGSGSSSGRMLSGSSSNTAKPDRNPAMKPAASRRSITQPIGSGIAHDRVAPSLSE